MLGLDLTKINDLTMAYGGFDVKRGFFDLVLDVDAKEGQLAGTVKPLFRNMVVFDLIQDVKEDRDPLQFFLAGRGGFGVVCSQQSESIAVWYAHPVYGNVERAADRFFGDVGKCIAKRVCPRRTCPDWKTDSRMTTAECPLVRRSSAIRSPRIIREPSAGFYL